LKGVGGVRNRFPEREGSTEKLRRERWRGQNPLWEEQRKRSRNVSGCRLSNRGAKKIGGGEDIPGGRGSLSGEGGEKKKTERGGRAADSIEESSM